MNVNVSGRNIDIGQAFHTHAADVLNEAAKKYFGRPIDAAVTISKEGPLYHVECSLHAFTGVTLHASSEANDAYLAFDQAAEKIEKQLRRMKRRIKNHHESQRGANAV